MRTKMTANDRLVRIQFDKVLRCDALIDSCCFGGIHQSVVFAELRLLGKGPKIAYQTMCIKSWHSWRNQIFEFIVTTNEIIARVLHLSLYAVDMFGFSTRLGEAAISLTYFEDEKHKTVINHTVSLVEYEVDAPTNTCFLDLSVAVWTAQDIDAAITLEYWEAERYHDGWSAENLKADDVCKRKMKPAPEPEGFIASLDWYPDIDQGDENGWFYASHFGGPWHNSNTAFVCRCRRLIQRYLPREYQLEKQAKAELLHQDHTTTVDRLVKTQEALVQLENVSRHEQNQHRATVFRMELKAAAKMKAFQRDYEATLAEEIQAHAESKKTIDELMDLTANLQAKLEALKLENKQLLLHHAQTKMQIPQLERQLPSRRCSFPRTLRVQLVRALDLVAADLALLGGKSDPYVVFQIGNVKLKSTQHTKELNPVWDHEVFEFELSKETLQDQSLTVSVFDHDKLSSDDLIGLVSIPILSLNQSSHDDTNEATLAPEITYKLEIPPEFSDQKVDSRIVLRFELPTQPVAIVLEMWENQRYSNKKWLAHNLLKSDRAAWTNGTDGNSLRDAIEPQIPNNMHTILGWTVNKQQGDSDGWFYAKSFQGPWLNSRSFNAVVRRRLWIERCFPNE
ncbi:C2 domain-containing protein [Thraustotheca clavata]|uniref:C2 domain-containing protein n=1 Tax=Thraustotheca clavata TaxID=74557 RepID=A0A1V9ZYM5_9STRA|nr:C2 domain-containing protein [Thraustotheca clavata]